MSDIRHNHSFLDTTPEYICTYTSHSFIVKSQKRVFSIIQPTHPVVIFDNQATAVTLFILTLIFVSNYDKRSFEQLNAKFLYKNKPTLLKSSI